MKLFSKKHTENLQESKNLRTFAALLEKKHIKGSGFSAVGSAHVWGARGRWFESSNPDQTKKDSSTVLFLLNKYTTGTLCT